MKKLLITLTAVVVMLSGSLTVQAKDYNETVGGVQCYGSVSGNNVFAYTAASGTVVTITSTAYDANDRVITSQGNAANGYVSVSYTASGVEYAEQTHGAPNLGVSVTRRVYR